MYIQYGEITFSHKQSTTDTWVDSISSWTATPDGYFYFPEPFKAETTINIQITPVVSGVFERSSSPFLINPEINSWDNTEENIIRAASHNKSVEWCLGSGVDYRKFNLKTKTNNAYPAGIPFKFNWMAIGEKA